MEHDEYLGRLKMARKIGLILLSVCLGWTLGAIFVTPPFKPIEMIISAYLLGSGMGVMVGRNILVGETQI